MQRHGLLSLFTNLFLLFFLFSGPMLSSGIPGMVIPGFVKAAGTITGGSPGGNLAIKLMETVLGPVEKRDRKDTTEPREEIIPDSVELIYEYYPVYGSSIDEISGSIYDIHEGKGPYDEKEEKRYAAYVTTDFKVKFQPVILGYGAEVGKVEIELGAEAEIGQKIRLHLPDFRTQNPDLDSILEQEEERLLAHEMQHVSIYRSTEEKLQAYVNSLIVTGIGSNFWEALADAKDILREKIDASLRDAVESADQMNAMLDRMTRHGLSMELLLKKEMKIDSSFEKRAELPGEGIVSQALSSQSSF